MAKPNAFQHVFNQPTADVVLRSSDKVDFKVHKIILSDASPVFSSMFALPLPSQDEDMCDGLHKVQMAEPADAIHALLGVLYPGKGPRVSNTDCAALVLQLADKYAMDGVTKHVRSLLGDPGFLRDEWSVLHVYALSRKYGFADLAEAAARESLQYPFQRHGMSGLHVMTGADYHELLAFREACAGLIDEYLLELRPCGWLELWELLTTVWGDGDDDERLECNRSRLRQRKAQILELINCPEGNGHHHVLWFQLHFCRQQKAYKQSVCGKSVTSRRLLDEAINGMDCKECIKWLPMQLIEFNDRLGRMLDDDIQQVKFSKFIAQRS
ncbi:BTB domain-containing protein [Phanerochaete sordida]|uniref:BTB domain-containing protein n=1 Tax=Phanerochaete sordida TaxID=48140 RepID=A0A9P3GN71_9APHY|nr:BTB domain-containing protein [Phanerochaete sordida]